MNFKVVTFTALTPQQLYTIYHLRVAVFVVEQTCAYQEVDDLDLTAEHLLGVDADGRLMAYARLMQAPNQQARIGRVLVNPADRGHGYGQLLVQTAIEQIQQLWPETTQIKIQAQHYLDQFYQSFGFKPVSSVYLEDDIPHQDMILAL
ncbi:GNAT family N-acetyltransferase [Lactobacillus pentosus] [Lactiplantibacillus mudanjiangensis]|uniref:GNAT family N-acetyltransferase n=1 Tax=Lactiplantibacillus mudanjiangensis TaxID=1296538 RepID=UPI0010146CD7|nr:GNAT family N-acetyltransferase [Lactiplantibacillus mudanjiangensis]VDG33666.1 GNAT family N-acetyltransferase [Lactobacillus pentosus] [Lactiplantibacillus mudanjiangensis]